MIFCTWISFSWKTVADLCSHWNKQLVKSCTCEKWKQGKRGAGVQTQPLFTYDVFLHATYDRLLWLSCFHTSETRRNRSTKATQMWFTSFVCIGRKEGRCTLRRPRARGDKVKLCRVCCNNYCGNNRLVALILYVVRGLTSPCCSLSQSLLLTVSSEKNNTVMENKKEFGIDKLQSLLTWSGILEFLIAMRFYILFGVSVMLGVGFSIGSVWIIAGRLQMCPTGHSRQDYFRD